MVRNLLGGLLALAGAAAAVWSPFRVWYGSRPGRSYRIGELFSSDGVTGAHAGLWTGLFLPMLAAAVLTLLAVAARSRLLVALAGLLVLGFVVLWTVRQGQAAGTLTAGAGGLGEGVGLAYGGGVLLLLAAPVLRGRRPRGRRRKGRVRGYGQGYGRVDDSYAGTAAATGSGDFGDQPGYGAYGEQEHSEMPQPYGPFEGTPAPPPSPHGAYREDVWPPYDQTEAADTRDTAAQQPYEPRQPHPDDQQRDDQHRDDSTPPEEWDPWGSGPGPADQPPQGPQRQPPRRPPGSG